MTGFHFKTLNCYKKLNHFEILTGRHQNREERLQGINWFAVGEGINGCSIVAYRQIYAGITLV
jgi:hypothetical protein